MEIIDFDAAPTDFLKSSTVTIGNFDGAHLGHRAIIGKALERARVHKAPVVVVTFQPHPREVIHRGEIVPAIVPFSERARLISEMGVDCLLKVEFTPQFAEQAAEEFISKVVDKVHPKVVVIGHDFRFGKGREGDEDFLERIGKRLGFSVDSVPVIEVAGEAVSSTRIRSLVQEGDLKQANKLLGAPFSIEGAVVRGRGRGKSIGFATANLRWQTSLIPAEGVYAAVAYWNGNRFPAVVNIGDNPTFGDQELSMEAHVIGFSGDLYSKFIRLGFHRRLRGEIKFDSAEALAAQIKNDVARAREVLIADTGEDLFAKVEKAGSEKPGPPP